MIMYQKLIDTVKWILLNAFNFGNIPFFTYTSKRGAVLIC